MHDNWVKPLKISPRFQHQDELFKSSCYIFIPSRLSRLNPCPLEPDIFFCRARPIWRTICVLLSPPSLLNSSAALVTLGLKDLETLNWLRTRPAPEQPALPRQQQSQGAIQVETTQVSRVWGNNENTPWKHEGKLAMPGHRILSVARG